MFDFDGVLIDTLLACYTINAEIHENLSLEEYKSFFEGNIYSAKRYNGEPKKSHPNFDELYKTRTREIKIPESIKDILKFLSDKYILAIVSSTPTDSIKKILEKENCIYFEDILGADVHTDKTLKIKMLLEKYNISPAETVFITDTIGDIREAEKCKVKSIAVTWGFQSKEVLVKANPEAIIEDPKDLIGAILDVVK